MKIENTDELRLLVECARGGSLTAASRVMQITPAAASAMLKKLEARLGVRLVERSTRALRLSAAGEQLRDYGQRALELLDEGVALVSEGQGMAKGRRTEERLRGRIRLSASSDLTRRQLLPLLDAFMHEHPGVELHLSVSDSLLDIYKDEVDVAIRYGLLADSGLVARKLTEVNRLAVASPAFLKRHGRPAHPSELSACECLTFKIRNRHERQWRFRLSEASTPLAVPVQGRRSTDDGEIAHGWALAGLGVVYKSELDVRASLAQGLLVNLFPDWIGDRLPLHAVMPSQRFMPQRVRALVEHLAQGLQAQPSDTVAARPQHR
ncbi:LysR family transcriptional regulator [Paucibacter soli]|uniref:LysR family transcriptional regulator n=1 Tax=Paucibacter soli TaxID=3133433 RepID=UPI003096038C